jgi:hypothetical protein
MGAVQASILLIGAQEAEGTSTTRNAWDLLNAVCLIPGTTYDTHKNMSQATSVPQNLLRSPLVREERKNSPKRSAIHWSREQGGHRD